jgi:O-antigen ligase
MSTSYRQVVSYGPQQAEEANPIRALVHHPGFGLFLLMVAHPLLALAMKTSSLVATAHAGVTLLIGLLLALGKDKRKVAYVAAYIAGAEVLWRMTEARIFWEGGKYFTILILGIALLRIKPWQRSALPLLYFLLLCLSIPLTISNLGLSHTAREAISFNLSGPFSLTICILYFSQIGLDQGSMRRIAWWLLMPVLGIASLAISATLSAEVIVFTNDSNFITSGGYGPNQVSAVLGLGGGLALILFLTGKGLAQRWLVLSLALGLLTLSALTFSRGGLYNAALMLALAMVHYLRSARGRVVTAIALLAIGLAGGYLIFPRLNAFTGGMLSQRFTNLDLTSRGEIAQADLNLWVANPLLGVGPGFSKTDRMALLGYGAGAHTEYTRVLAEHGTAGLLALLMMLVMSIRAYLRTPNLEAQAWVAALLAWPLMEMSHAAMRIVAISFLFGLALVNWDTGESVVQAANNRAVRH